MILLQVQHIAKHFGPEPVLADVTFEVRPGEKWGLVGPNGAGKSTLLNLLAGKLEADSGSIEWHSSAHWGYLEQQPDFAPERTLWEEARSALDDLLALNDEAERLAELIAQSEDDDERRRLGKRFDHLQHELQHRDAYHVDHKIERVLDGLGFDREAHGRPVRSLSGGQQNRLLLAKLLLRDPGVLLLDEPSNHLDIEATEWLERYLSESDQALVVVSHDRYFLDEICNGILELFQGEIDSYAGNYSDYWRQREERNKVQSRTFARQQELIAKTEDFIRRNHYGQKSAQAKDREKKLARIERIKPPREIVAPAMGFPPVQRSGDLVLRVERLSKGFDRPLFHDLSFDIQRGERWGIVGPNGTGKTTLLRCLVGQLEPDSGASRFGSNVRVGYYDQLLSGLDDQLQVVDAIRPPGKEFTEPERRGLLARFGLTGDRVFQPVDSLSGGERSRAALARLSASDANLLVLDEPTNHLDLWACDALERSLQEFEGTVLFVSHDRYFLNRVADHVLVVEPDRFRVIEGNYDTYLYQRSTARDAAARDSRSAAGAPSAAGKKALATSNERRKRRFPYRKVADLEVDIAAQEARLAELQSLLVTPEVLRDGRRVKQIQVDIEGTEQALRQLYEHWEEACELNG